MELAAQIKAGTGGLVADVVKDVIQCMQITRVTSGNVVNEASWFTEIWEVVSMYLDTGQPVTRGYPARVSRMCG